jgi:hypothetical protein
VDAEIDKRSGCPVEGAVRYGLVESGRGERISADTFQLNVRIVGQSVLTNVHRATEIA